MNKGLGLSLLIGGLLAMPAQAQRNAGRNAAAFLEVGVGAREVAMGSAVSSITNDANQIFWNPAGTALREDQALSASFSYGSWIGDIGYTGAAVGYNLGRYGTVTAGIQSFGVSGIPADRQNGYDDPVLQGLVTDTETSETYSFQDLAASISYSRYVVDRLSLGATAKVVNESIDGVNATAFGFDFGSVYDIGLQGWKISARINNLGTNMSFYNQDNPLPLNFTIGTSIYPVNTEQVRLMVAADAVKQQDSPQLIFGGAEVSFFDLLFLRGGYKFNYSGAADSGTASRDPIDTSVENYSLGGGIQYVIQDKPVAIDYAFTSMDLFENVHRVSLRIGL
jgi:hypothetical protein